jgi:thioester reductase-like protein
MSSFTMGLLFIGCKFFIILRYPYEKLKAPNILSTKEIIKMAITHKIKPIHYVSTTSVFDSDKYDNVSDIYEDTEYF